MDKIEWSYNIVANPFLNIKEKTETKMYYMYQGTTQAQYTGPQGRRKAQWSTIVNSQHLALIVATIPEAPRPSK